MITHIQLIFLQNLLDYSPHCNYLNELAKSYAAPEIAGIVK